MLPCLLFEDEHLLVVNKPAGLNTHAPSPYAGEGLYDWLRHRESRWSALAIIHRLDKETSGVLVFSKTLLANRSLTEQFARREVEKSYLLATDQPVPRRPFTVETALVRAGERYVSRPLHAGGVAAVTRFRVLPPAELESLHLPPALRTVDFGASPKEAGANPEYGERRDKRHRLARGLTWVEAQPLTGRTHQIRAHAAERGFSILGDELYGGAPAPRLYLHAYRISFKHPVTGHSETFSAAPNFRVHPRVALRLAIVEPDLTDSFRVLHGATDGWPGVYLDRLGAFLLCQSQSPLTDRQDEQIAELCRLFGSKAAYHKRLLSRVSRASSAEASPQPIQDERAPDHFVIRENGLQFELSFREGYSTGLFLDQRDNRRRLLNRRVDAGFELFGSGVPASAEVLNTFAYTCGFSVCAAKAGVRVTSLDLSRKYLEWGKRNFLLNQIDPAGHDFIHGDVFDWLRRLGKKQRTFDLVLLDPPTFSRSRDSGVFRAGADYGRLVVAALPVLKPGGVLFVSTNAGDWPAPDFVSAVAAAINLAGRKVLRLEYFPQPPDFPISRSEPAYLKTAWLRVA